MNTTGTGCEEIFHSTQYLARHLLSGPTYHTSVLHFVDIELTTEPGFFDGMTLIGLLGYSGDIRAEKQIEKAGASYFIVSEGYLGAKFLFTRVTVEKRGHGTTLCTAAAEFSAFN